ncbi:MAG TPA: pyroglutamyl-peptidase I [Terrimesophilobacter sp.]|nr:pyroglutamyl-peptidase I [Terrimesophilobacter sp.]
MTTARSAEQPTVLLTGFEPFGGANANSSWDAVQLVARDWRGPARLVTACLPAEFSRAGDTLGELIDEHTPDLVIATGVAGGRTKLTPERVAINLADARIPDNAGAQPLEQAIVDDGPDAYFTRLPVSAMVGRMTMAEVPAEASLSAGTYVCNDVMYRMMRHVSGRGTIAGFIHVPDAETLPLETIAAGLRAAVEAGLEASAAS